MSVEQLAPPAVTGWLSAARDSVQAAAEVPVGAMSVDELTDGISEAAALETQAAALKLRLLAEADDRRVAATWGATGTDAWSARLTGSTPAAMAGRLWLARLLESTYGATREAFADGGINEAQARVIVRAGEKLPSGVSEEERRAAEAGLVAKAVNGMDARGLRQAGRRMLDVVSQELADQQEAAQLEAEEGRAEFETWLSLRDNEDGTFSGRFTIPELHGQMLRTYLDHLTSPRRLSSNRAGGLVQDDTLPTGGPVLPWADRLGLALCELIEHLPTDGFGAVAATVIVTIPLKHLEDGLAAAAINGGTRLSAGDARRLGCGAGLVPAVLGSRSEPLDLGFSHRLHSIAQRRAYALLHDTCAAEGCQRPLHWCDIHHPRWWSRGGPTDLANGIPLCGHHHRRAHDSGFDLERLPSGEVRFRRRR